MTLSAWGTGSPPRHKLAETCWWQLVEWKDMTLTNKPVPTQKYIQNINSLSSPLCGSWQWSQQGIRYVSPVIINQSGCAQVSWIDVQLNKLTKVTETTGGDTQRCHFTHADSHIITIRHPSFQGSWLVYIVYYTTGTVNITKTFCGRSYTWSDLNPHQLHLLATQLALNSKNWWGSVVGMWLVLQEFG